jgi:ABC-type sugar transport system substrate-binding protein
MKYFVPSRRVNQEERMRKVSIFVLVAVFAVLVAAVSPSAASAKDLRWHGVLVRVSEDGSTLTVRKGNVEKAVHVNEDTKYTEAKGKKVVEIEKGDIKEGDDLICIGKDENGDFMATRVDKRLPQ